MRVLLIEDGGQLAESIVEYLQHEGADCIELAPAGNFAGLAGVLSVEDAGLRRALAACDGVLLPHIQPVGGCYPLYRLLAERVLCVNTTAAGGNTTLMTLSI